MTETINVILFVYNFSDNTTSANRYKSIAESFLRKKNIRLKIIELSFQKEVNTISCDLDNKDHLPHYIADQLIYFQPKMNVIQRLVYRFKSKYVHFLYQIFFKKEVSTPSDFSILKQLKKENFQRGYVIVSGAPYGIFQYAKVIADKLDSKLVLDYRDPWTFGYTNIDGLSMVFKIKQFLQRKTEQKLIQQSTIVTTVSKTLKEYFPEVYQHKIHIIPNGSNYGITDIQPKSDSTFNIVYLGTVYNEQLNDDVFFEAFYQFLKDKETKNIKLYFIGSFYTNELKNKIEQFGLSEVTVVTKRLTKNELLPYLNNANAFLHLRYGNRTGIITSKQGDYLFFRKPVLLPVTDDGDIAESISLNNAGYVCRTVEENIAVLNKLWENFEKGQSLIIEQSEEFLKENSREAIADRFVSIVLNS